ncbi:MAG TPA: MASE1 domain-containing protein [Candidatus Dormibacteraeota bacterium]|nr:MASE1 domain-containing protein [Candidatus Dormibacteraeota bacterium]
MSDRVSTVGVSAAGKRVSVLKVLLQLAAVALAYWFAASQSLRLALVHGQVTPIWPPTGIALVAILVFGRRVWPAVFLAALAVNLPIGPTPLGAAFIAAGNTLAPLTAAALLQRAHFRIELDRLRDAAVIILLGALAAMTISATVGSSVLVLWGGVPLDSFWSTWAVWWTGDAMGVLLVAPFILSLLPNAKAPVPTPWTAAELVALLLVIGVVTFILFQNSLRLEYLVFPLIMLAAWRFRLRGAAPAALVASGVAIWAAVQGAGPFSDENLFQKMVTLQVFNVFLALTSFVLAAFIEARYRAAEMTRLYVSATAASQAKSSFLSMAAHELLTPLTVFTGYLSLLSGGSLGKPPDAWVTPVNILMQKTREMERIVSDLQSASSLEVVDSNLGREVIDLRKVVNEAVERAHPRAELLRAEVVVNVPNDPVPVEADEDHLGRVIDDLINNAFTYTIRTPRLVIGLSTRSRKAIVEVEDNGVGIKAADRERVFDRLYRVVDPQVVVPGIGLGLYICRQLAQSYGGSLAVETSKPGKGSVFALALPLSRTTSAAKLREAQAG